MPCPFVVEQAERERHEEERAQTRAYQEHLKKLYRLLEAEGDGWVPTERYEEARAMNEEQRLDWDETVTGGAYPIQDGAPSWFVDP
ncbi:Phosphotransferase enzyme [Ceratobasidium sp. 394]|nr:Phosphotransferase enzyme [Ceratobasidium sp. 394]